MTTEENTKPQETENKKQLVSSENIWQAFINVWKNCFDFKSRISRYDYWGFHTMYFLISLLFIVPVFINPSFSIVSSIFSFLAILPRISSSVRRLHDTGKSAFWWMLVPLAVFISGFVVKILGQIRGEEQTKSLVLFALLGLGFMVYIVVLLVQLVRKGDESANKYGEPMIETARQKRVGKYLAILMVCLPLILFVAVFCVGAISGYSKAMRQYNTNHSIGINAPYVPIHSQP